MRFAIKAVFSLPVVITLVVLGGCKQEIPAKIEPVRPVRSLVVQASSVESTLTLPGEIRPRIETRYGFRIGGKIAERRVSVGDRVSTGTVLARLDPQDVAPAIAAQAAQVQAAQTDLTLARAELARQKELRSRNYISAAQLERQQAAADASEARLEAARAQLASARNNARFQELKADAPGVVTAVDGEAGQVVAPGQSVIRVAGTTEKEVLINLPEAQVDIARSVDNWSVVVPALDSKTWPARLRELTPVSDPASRTYPMRLSLVGNTKGVELGMTAVVQAIREQAPAFVLPMSVLWSRDGRPHVWKVDVATNKVHGVEVRTAGLLDDRVRIVSGLAPGDRIVTAGASLLIEGQQVRLLESDQ